jgi:hypothetical protein
VEPACCYDAAVEQGHRDRGVVLEGYSALRGGTLEHPVITASPSGSAAPRAGHRPLAPRARHRRHPEVDEPRAHPQQRRVEDLVLSAEDLAALDGLAA